MHTHTIQDTHTHPALTLSLALLKAGEKHFFEAGDEVLTSHVAQSP